MIGRKGISSSRQVVRWFYWWSCWRSSRRRVKKCWYSRSSSSCSTWWSPTLKWPATTAKSSRVTSHQHNVIKPSHALTKKRQIFSSSPLRQVELASISLQQQKSSSTTLTGTLRMTSKPRQGRTALVRRRKWPYIVSSLPTPMNPKCSNSLLKSSDSIRLYSMDPPSNLWASSIRRRNSSQNKRFRLYSRKALLDS